MKQQRLGEMRAARRLLYLGSNIPGERLIFGLLPKAWAAAELVRRTLTRALAESIELERSLRGIWLQPEEARKALLQSFSRLVGRTRLKRQDRLRRIPGQTDRLRKDE